MSDLENLNIPIIGELMEDKPMSLDSNQQFRVARWATKTAMVQDAIYTKKRPLFYPESQRLDVRYERGLPAYTLVWLGRSSLRTLTADGTDFVLDVNDGTNVPGTANGSVHTFTVGHLTLQVATINPTPKYHGRAFELTPHIPAPWDQLLVPIWPTANNDVTWPPPLFFRNQIGLARLADRFRGGSRRDYTE